MSDIEMLKPCPFCGGKATLINNSYSYHIHKELPHDYCVICLDCKASTIHFSATEAEAIELWNRRAE